MEFEKKLPRIQCANARTACHIGALTAESIAAHRDKVRSLGL